MNSSAQWIVLRGCHKFFLQDVYHPQKGLLFGKRLQDRVTIPLVVNTCIRTLAKMHPLFGHSRLSYVARRT